MQSTPHLPRPSPIGLQDTAFARVRPQGAVTGKIVARASCPVCGRSFYQRTGTHRFCTPVCRERAKSRRPGVAAKYGYDHQQLRAKVTPAVETGKMACVRCGLRIERGKAGTWITARTAVSRAVAFELQSGGRRRCCERCRAGSAGVGRSAGGPVGRGDQGSARVLVEPGARGEAWPAGTAQVVAQLGRVTPASASSSVCGDPGGGLPRTTRRSGAF